MGGRREERPRESDPHSRFVEMGRDSRYPSAGTPDRRFPRSPLDERIDQRRSDPGVLCRKFTVPSRRAERPIPGVTEAGDDEPVVVNVVVDGDGEQVGVRVLSVDTFEPGGGGDRRENEQLSG